ncbi:NADH:ubiquinone reductase (Na(+)-transporting) subunit F, partial [Vibrio parahaemolyticus]|nr:NADH:ubiquinone reductase (Na(+)-transporting) subunit F [Vibrio parahaemolyticus]
AVIVLARVIFIILAKYKLLTKGDHKNSGNGEADKAIVKQPGCELVRAQACHGGFVNKYV